MRKHVSDEVRSGIGGATSGAGLVAGERFSAEALSD